MTLLNNNTNAVNKALTIKVQNFQQAGLTVAQIAKKCKVKQAIVQAIIEAKAAPVTVSYVNAVVETATTEVVVEKEKEAPVVVDKLAQMLLAASAQKTEVKTETQVKAKRNSVTVIKTTASPAKDAEGNSVQRRNLTTDLRAIAIFTSEALNECWIGAHLGFATKTAAGAMNIMRNAPQKTLANMQKAEDAVMYISHTNAVRGNDVDTKKAQMFDLYAEMGYTMICKRPKIELVVDITAETVVAPQATTFVVQAETA